MKYSIIGHGTIGTVLSNQLDQCTIYDRQGFSTFLNFNHNIVIVAAPSSNRLWVNTNPETDLLDCQKIVNTLAKATYRHLIYISTVDIYPTKFSTNNRPDACPNSGYGHNRWKLESQLANLPNSKIIRLPSLCHHSIKKNILFDLKHQQWLDKISLESEIQWYPLDRLGLDIQEFINSNNIFENFVSPPINNKDIVKKFSPNLLTELENNQNITHYKYDIRSSDSSYLVSLDTIWKKMSEYFS